MQIIHTGVEYVVDRGRGTVGSGFDRVSALPRVCHELTGVQ